MKRLLLTILIITSLSKISIAQDLLTSKTSGFYTYIFKLSDKETESIYKDGIESVNQTFFHSLIDSVEQNKSTTLPYGHYLFVDIDDANLDISLKSFNNVDLKILNFIEKDLAIAVHDSSGKVIKNIEVYLENKKLSYNKAEHAFHHTNSKLSGLVKVPYKGVNNYFLLHNRHFVKRRYHRSFFYSIKRTLFYDTPLKHIHHPIRDIINAVRWGNVPVPNALRRMYFNLREKIEGNGRDKYRGYMAMNKPMYKRGDTVKLKAFILKRSGKPIKKPMNLTLNTRWGKTIKDIGIIRPYRKGGYKYEFILDDSLGLRLDERYNVSIENKRMTGTISKSFKYEDYELQENTYNVKSQDDIKREPKKKKQTHIRGENMALYLSSKNSNNLNALGTKVKITVMPWLINGDYDESLFVADTFWVHEQELDAIGDTKIMIPDSIFPPISLLYDVSIKFFNPLRNEVYYDYKRFDYIHNYEELEITLEKDSIYVNYIKNGITPSSNVTLERRNKHGLISKNTINVPYKEKVNPNVFSYYVHNKYSKKSQKLLGNIISCEAVKTDGKIIITTENSHNIKFWYMIRNANDHVINGFGKRINFEENIKNSQSYFVTIQYLWGGTMKKQEFNFSFPEKKLQITVDQPDFISPGQEVDLKINVKNAKGKPASNVDLTAFAFTKKFGRKSSITNIPYFGKEYDTKSTSKDFTVKRDLNYSIIQKGLKWENWKQRAGLDSLEYYKFLFPKDSIYKNYIPTPDASTQVAPFFMENGKAQKVYFMYIDGNPAYFSGSQTPNYYSFITSHNSHHQVVLRLSDKMIEFNDVWLKKGFKNIISVSSAIKNSSVVIKELPNRLLEKEKNYWNKYLIRVKNDFKIRDSYLKQDNRYYVFNRPTYHKNYIIGPLLPDYASFITKDRNTTKFRIESLYHYHFDEEVIKMKKIDKMNELNNLLTSDFQPIELGRFAINDDYFKPKKKEGENEKKLLPWFYNPEYTEPERGKLIIELYDKEPNLFTPKHILLQKQSDSSFIRTYEGDKNIYHDLEKDIYKITFINKEGEYIIKDGYHVKVNGSNYYKIHLQNKYKRDEYIDSLIQVIKDLKPIRIDWSLINKKAKNKAKKEKQKKNIFNSNQRNIYDNNYNETITGVVVDENEEPLPGVSVVVKGTTIGTVTNIDGEFSLNTPPDATIFFSFIGYKTQEVGLYGYRSMDIKMVEDTEALEEVVVTAFGIETRRSGRSERLDSNNNLSIDDDFDIFSKYKGALLILNNLPYSGKVEDIDKESLISIKYIEKEKAIEMFGDKAGNGVLMIRTRNKNKVKGDGIPSLRNNFSDYAFWKPDLKSNWKGQASFKVKFPDDITTWNTFVIGMDNKRRSGQMKSEIKSFKTLSADLSIPHFILKGDSIEVKGKVSNYSLDTLNITSIIESEGKKISTQSSKVLTSVLDRGIISTTSKDTVNVKYYMTDEFGYSDGEQKKIPVYQKGTLETKGEFIALQKDSTYTLKFNPKLGDIKVYAHANAIDILLSEIKHIRNYAYLCNEQTASKLKMILAEKEIKSFLGQPWTRKKEAKKLVDRLIKKRNVSGMWGWWKNGPDVIWISKHVTEALMQAKDQGFQVELDFDVLFTTLYDELFHLKTNDRISNLILLKKMQDKLNITWKLNYSEYIDNINEEKLNLTEYLKLQNLKADVGLDFKIDSVLLKRKETIFGNYYWGEEKYHLHNNAISITLLTYQLLKKKGGYEKDLSKIIDYLFERRNEGKWRNTFESAKIVKTILPDLLKGKNAFQKPILLFEESGKEIDKFPYSETISNKEYITIKNKGDLPIYFTAYQELWNQKPAPIKKDLIVTTRLTQKGKEIENFTDNKPIKMVVEVEVKKDAEYVMIEIPIPAGCSYLKKEKNYLIEAHREYYYHKTNIYCEKLDKGNYTFQVDLMPRFKGKYTINPAKAELMYYPVFVGRNEMKKVEIK